MLSKDLKSIEGQWAAEGSFNFEDRWEDDGSKKELKFTDWLGSLIEGPRAAVQNISFGGSKHFFWGSKTCLYISQTFLFRSPGPPKEMFCTAARGHLLVRRARIRPCRARIRPRGRPQKNNFGGQNIYFWGLKQLFGGSKTCCRFPKHSFLGATGPNRNWPGPYTASGGRTKHFFRVVQRYHCAYI